MGISPTILISRIFASIIIFILQSLLLRYLSKRDLINTKLLINISFLFAFILCLPFEFPFTITVPSKRIMPLIYTLLVFNLYAGFQVLDLIMVIWIAGSIISLVRLMIKYYHLIKFIKLCSKDLKRWENNFSSKHNYYILRLNIPDAPMVIGLFKPIIILPDLQFSDKELDFIIRHECIHISNKDLLIKYFYEFFICVYWWNPLVYSFRNYTNQLIEIRTDDLLTCSYTNQEKIDYINSLVKVTTMTKSQKIHPFSASFSTTNKNLLFNRSKNILLKPKSAKYNSKISLFSIILFILTYFMLSSFVIEPYFIKDSDKNSSFEISNDNAYLIKDDEQYLLYVNDQYIATITDLDSDPNLKNLKILSK